mmetsp:Transcript_36170/g.79002  ORF Transcript_36170/g.79002 Transcript_36170/m.79002 type:complete len:250 (-) Transcript_36170:1690-2439(-)
MSTEFLIATCRKSGFVGGVLLRSCPGCIVRLTSADEPAMRSGACSAAAGAMPKGFLFTWMANPERGPEVPLEKVICNTIDLLTRESEAVTPKPVFPLWPGVVGARTVIFGAAVGAGLASSTPPPPRSKRSRPPPLLPDRRFPMRSFDFSSPLLSPPSIALCTSRRLAARSSSSISSSSWGLASSEGAFVLMRVTNSSEDLWYTLLMRERSVISLSRRPLSMTCESSRIVGLSPKTTLFVASGFVERRRQ